MEEIENWIKQCKREIKISDKNMLECLIWDVRGNKDLLEGYVRDLEDLEEEIEDKINSLNTSKKKK